MTAGLFGSGEVLGAVGRAGPLQPLAEVSMSIPIRAGKPAATSAAGLAALNAPVSG